MKKVYNPVPDFYTPEKRCCFWVRVVMQKVEISLRIQQNRQSYIYLVPPAKTTENTLLQ